MAETQRSPRISARELGAVVALAAVLLLINTLPTKRLPTNSDDPPGLDAHIYLAMAEAPTTFTRAPYAYRLGVPLIVHRLPFPHEVSFLLLAVTGLFLTLVFGYVFFRTLGFDHGIGLLGVTFLGTAPEISVYFRNNFLVDPMAFAFLALLLIAIERELDDAPTAFLLLIGSLFKESAFYVVPVLYLRISGGKIFHTQAARRTLLVSVPAIVAALVLRLWWSQDGVLFPYVNPWAGGREPWFGSMESYRVLWRGLFSYLAVLAIANAFEPGWRRFARRYAPFALLAVAQVIVPMNSHRVLFFGFPVVLPLALVEFERLRSELPQWFPLLTVILVFCYLFVPTQLAYPLAVIVFGRWLIERRRLSEAVP